MTLLQKWSGAILPRKLLVRPVCDAGRIFKEASDFRFAHKTRLTALYDAEWDEMMTLILQYTQSFAEMLGKSMNCCA